MFCHNCGASIEGRFCAACGSGTVAVGQPVQTTAGLTENVAGALCYSLGILTGVLFLVLAPYNQNPRVRFHAFQSLLFSGAVIAIWVGSMMIAVMLPLPLLLAFWALRICLSLFWFCVWLFLIFKTWQGDTVPLPVVGALARTQAGTN
jgi:uncharacterized membrane protein